MSSRSGWSSYFCNAAGLTRFTRKIKGMATIVKSIRRFCSATWGRLTQKSLPYRMTDTCQIDDHRIFKKTPDINVLVRVHFLLFKSQTISNLPRGGENEVTMSGHEYSFLFLNYQSIGH